MTHAAELPIATATLPRRSAIPKVIGILMIIFGSLGLLSALLGLARSSLDDMQAFTDGAMETPIVTAFAEVERIGKIVSLVGLPISVLHLVAGIAAVRYRASAPKLAIGYAVLAALHTLATTIVTATLIMPAMEAMMRELSQNAGPIGMSGFMSTTMTAALIGGTIVGLAWPTVVGVLMSRQRARVACIY